MKCIITSRWLEVCWPIDICVEASAVSVFEDSENYIAQPKHGCNGGYSLYGTLGKLPPQRHPRTQIVRPSPIPRLSCQHQSTTWHQLKQG